MCNVQTNSSAIGYWQEHWGCVSLKREGGAILMLSFIFVLGFALGRAGRVLVGQISGKENGAVGFI